MLRVIAHKSAAAARQYYAEGLKREDYYSQGQEIVAKWYGKAAARLGVSGGVTPEQFAALVETGAGELRILHWHELLAETGGMTPTAVAAESPPRNRALADTT